MNLKKETLIVILVVVVVVGYFLLNKDNNSSDGELVACTQEARQCSDGSFVGRTGPNCEFVECPTIPEPESVKTDGCNLVNNFSFRSIEKLDRGLGPNGIILGYWNVTFDEGSFSWGFSDVGANGFYTCENNILEATLNGLGQNVSGRYNPDTGILTWDDIEYIKSTE
jgi:hypothetical protein